MEGLNRTVLPAGNAPVSNVPMLHSAQISIMNNGQSMAWKGQWGPSLIPKGCLLIPCVRKRLIGGTMRQCFLEVRIVGPQDLKVDMVTWMLTNHQSSITNEEFDRYLKVFKTMDQKLIDKFLDDEQKELNERQPELERIE
jgi:hypothetical protein